MTQTDVTEMELATTAQPTALATLLEASTTPHELGNYRGVLTPLRLDAAEAETAALTTGAAVHDLGWLKRVAVHGEDRFRWLSGMVTNTVNDLQPHAGAWNLVLNAQGRVQGDLTVWRDGKELELEIAVDQYEKLMAHLDRFIIMDDVELVERSGETAIGLTGPSADEVLQRLSLPILGEMQTQTRVEWNGFNLRIVRGYGVLAPHYVLWVQVPGLKKLWQGLGTAGASQAGTERLEAFRIAEGIPAYGIDIVERDLPQETSQMRALHFSKGCYLGQEVVERIHSRGSVHKHLRHLELSGPLPSAGAELTFEDEAAGSTAAAGQITSAAELALPSGRRIFALGMVREDAEARKQPLSYTAGSTKGTARILEAAPNII
jgi:folate-binding protein YgfZ